MGTTNGHAPTPWRNAGGMVDGYAVIGADRSEIVPAIHGNNANARFIVQAVNSHDALVAALCSVLEWADPYALPNCERNNQTIDNAKAALTLAETAP